MQSLLRHQLDSPLDEFALVGHPLFTACESGDLPMEVLQLFAEQHARCVFAVPTGWRTAGYPEHAEEERRHARLWHEFAKAMDVQIVAEPLPGTEGLEDLCQVLFGSRPEALGALYAYERQQQDMARSVLTGMQAHFIVPEAAQPYFIEHLIDVGEADILLREISEQPSQHQARSLDACRAMYSALYDAMSDICIAAGWAEGLACQPRAGTHTVAA